MTEITIKISLFFSDLLFAVPRAYDRPSHKDPVRYIRNKTYGGKKEWKT